MAYRGYDGNNNREGGNSVGGKYVGAPYNFVPVSDKVYPYPETTPPAHNKPDASEDGEYLDGEITYRITAQTPVFVGSGIKSVDNVETFFKDVKGRYAIPGSTMRGLIRSNVQVLSLSSFADDIDNYALMYRKVGAKAEDVDKKPYDNILGSKVATLQTGAKTNSVSVLKNVRAGYVKKVGSEYYIYDTTVRYLDASLGKMNYYVLSERKIAYYYENFRKRGGSNPYDFFWRNGSCILQNIMKDERTFTKVEGRGNRNPKYKGDKNKAYVPYFEPCSYEVSGLEVVAVGNPGVYKNSGYAVSTGFMNEKKAVYIIPEMDANADKSFDEYQFPIKISRNDYDAFQIDLNRRRTTLKTFGGADKFDLPGDDAVKPVFYIQIGSRLYFGFTPRLRLFYNHTVHDGLPSSQKRDGLDYAKAIFGYSQDTDSYKTRVSFADAIVLDTAKEDQREDRILAEPKPTSVMDYLVPINSDKADSYNSDDFQIRGIKQYWVRENLDKKYGLVDADKKDKEFVSHFMPLQQGTSFSGKIRFHHLKKDELGLLVWALHPEDQSWLNLGKAKAFGFGTMNLEIEQVRILDMDKVCDLDTLQLDPYKTLADTEIKEAVDTFRRGLAGFLDGKRPETESSISTFLLMKNKNRIPEDEKIRQMRIGDKLKGIQSEYQNRYPLPMPEDIAKPKSVETEQAKSKLEKGMTFEASVTKIDGKYVKFRIESMGINDRFSVEKIRYKQLTKKELSTEFRVGATVKVSMDGIETGENQKEKLIWSCVEKL